MTFSPCSPAIEWSLADTTMRCSPEPSSCTRRRCAGPWSTAVNSRACMVGCTLPEAGSMSWISVPSCFVVATATGCPVSSSWTLTIGPTTATPSKVRRSFKPDEPFELMPKTAVVAPLVTAKTPGVACHCIRRKSEALPLLATALMLDRSSSAPGPPQIGTADSVVLTRKTRCVSAIVKALRRSPRPTDAGRLVFSRTFPLLASTWRLTADEPSALAATTHRLPSSGRFATAQNCADVPASVA
mmetsp:Transcript_52570/g.159816  ORF Transcript_52570/g.159816 Transcript_52570/m.159816 type:complete len:243 (+) Transcript_52570:1850-2578(+)